MIISNRWKNTSHVPVTTNQLCSVSLPNPDDPCMVYLPTKLGHLWAFYVGKSTSTMDDLGKANTRLSPRRESSPLSRPTLVALPKSCCASAEEKTRRWCETMVGWYRRWLPKKTTKSQQFMGYIIYIYIYIHDLSILNSLEPMKTKCHY